MKKAETNLPAVSRKFKDTVFRKLFSSEESLLSLYNAVMGTDYDKLDDFEITTTENPIYIGMRNDVAFVADFQVHLYEHQSTMNPNMPLRDLFYVSQLYGKMLGDKNIFAHTPISLPTPNFIVFYNGVQKHPEVMEYRLSDLYTIKQNPLQMELIVKVININAGCNEELLNRCEELSGYQMFVEKVRLHSKQMDLKRAIDQAVRECIDEDILKDFFLENRKEVVTMSLWEFDQEKYERMLQEAAKEEGLELGRELGREQERTLLNTLTSYLLRDNRMDDLKQSLGSPGYQNSLLKEYSLV